tara:strand:+ start:43 stop:507 length:465 start_codon:yes stop_codon:yes gene_type:complete
MPYLGLSPAVQTTAMSYQDLTGGTGTSFTLDFPVSNASEIEVFVNNVRQEPTVAYTVNATSLSMTGSIAATDDFYVVFQGKALVTSSSSGGGGTFKGENGEINAGGGDIFRVHQKQLDTNTTIDADENALAAGPLTIATGVTLTVTSGGNLVIA